MNFAAMASRAGLGHTILGGQVGIPKAQPLILSMRYWANFLSLAVAFFSSLFHG